MSLTQCEASWRDLFAAPILRVNTPLCEQCPIEQQWSVYEPPHGQRDGTCELDRIQLRGLSTDTAQVVWLRCAKCAATLLFEPGDKNQRYSPADKV